MYLKQFELDLPYIPNEKNILSIMNTNNCIRAEATKMDYKINWKDKRQKFSLETRNISAMYERLFNKIQTENCWKVLVECVEHVQEEKVINYSGVNTVQIEFNHDDFLIMDEYEKRKITLELIMEGIRIIAKIKRWDTKPFEDVYHKIIELDYTNEWIWKKALKSINKKNSAEILCQHKVDSIEISIVFKDAKGFEIGRRKIITEQPDEFAYTRHLGKLKWISDSEVTLFNKSEDCFWTAQL